MRARTLRQIALAAALAAPIGCEGEMAPTDPGGLQGPPEGPEEPPAEPADPGTPEATANEPRAVDLEPGEVVDLMPASPAPDPPHRARRRMDLDQLGAAIRRVTGGMAWTEAVGGRDIDQLEALAATLGKPDYIQITTEDLSPSALFQKFLDDAARSVCTRLAERERGGLASRGSLLIHVGPDALPATEGEAVDRNLSALLLRFHSRVVLPGDPALTHWRWLLDSAVHVSGAPMEGWRAVCVGLITHPDFWSY
jgi:hypothetical protein